MRQFILIAGLIVAGNASGQSELIQQTIKFYDSSRNRESVTEVWYPAGAAVSSFPLVMFSHGTGGNRLASEWFCRGLASKGFIVAAVDHFGNTYTNPIPKEFVSIWQRPLDISFVITQLLKEETFSSRINDNKIYAAGFSLGGWTSFALAGAEFSRENFVRFSHTSEGIKEVNIPEMPGLIKMLQTDTIALMFKKSPDLQDKRIKAIFVMAPAAGQGFESERQMRKITLPVYIIGAAADSIAPVRTNAGHYKNLIPDAKWYLIPGGAGHYVFLNSNEEMKNAAPVFFKDAEGVDREKIHREMVDLAANFFSK